MKISSITARKIVASLGNHTVEAVVEFADGPKSTASVPAGLSAGKYEIAKVSADEAVGQTAQINQICAGREWTQEALDKEISSHGFGGNATLAVSAAFFKAGYKLRAASYMPRAPKLMLLLFEGGKHGSPNITFQEFMIVEDAVAQAREDFAAMRQNLQEQNIETTVGVEGAFSPASFNNEKALEIIKTVFPGKKIALDIAASSCQGETLTGAGYVRLVQDCPITSLEDPFDDEHWADWSNLTNLLGGKMLIVGDDLTVTNPERIKKAIDLKAINAVIIKPNQIGTITGALEAVRVAREGGLKIVVSHRGEETSDTWIVDFALAAGADFVKFGGFEREERVAKYNRLLARG